MDAKTDEAMMTWCPSCPEYIWYLCFVIASLQKNLCSIQNHNQKQLYCPKGMCFCDNNWCLTLNIKQSKNIEIPLHDATKTWIYIVTCIVNVFVGLFVCLFWLSSGTSDDEMCNFYIMYYMESKHATPFMSCMDPGSSELFSHIPVLPELPVPVDPHNMMAHKAMAGGKTGRHGNLFRWNIMRLHRGQQGLLLYFEM